MARDELWALMLSDLWFRVWLRVVFKFVALRLSELGQL